jgi:hypothetical protein
MPPDCVPRIIGRGGCNAQAIATTGAKVRIRGQRSGHKEADTGMEANVPLQLVVTCAEANPEGFHTAVTMAVALLRGVVATSRARGRPRFLVYSLRPRAENLVHECLEDVPRLR